MINCNKFHVCTPNAFRGVKAHTHTHTHTQSLYHRYYISSNLYFQEQLEYLTEYMRHKEFNLDLMFCCQTRQTLSNQEPFIQTRPIMSFPNRIKLILSRFHQIIKNFDNSCLCCKSELFSTFRLIFVQHPFKDIC